MKQYLKHGRAALRVGAGNFVVSLALGACTFQAGDADDGVDRPGTEQVSRCVGEAVSCDDFGVADRSCNLQMGCWFAADTDRSYGTSYNCEDAGIATLA